MTTATQSAYEEYVNSRLHQMHEGFLDSYAPADRARRNEFEARLVQLFHEVQAQALKPFHEAAARQLAMTPHQPVIWNTHQQGRAD